MMKLFAVGNCTGDARLLEVGGKNAAQFSIGVRTSTKDKETNGYVSNFISVLVFGPQVNSCSRLKKGDRVAVSGDACATSYMTRDGRPGANINLRADSVDFLTPRNTQAEPVQQAVPQPQGDMFDPEEELPF